MAPLRELGLEIAPARGGADAGAGACKPEVVMTSPRFRRDAVRYYNTEDGLRLIENGVYGFIVLRNTERTRGELGHSQRFYILSGADTPGGRFPGKPEWIEALAALPGSRWSSARTSSAACG